MNEYLIFLSSLFGLIISSWLFTESVEKTFSRFNLGTNFIGSIIAPLFTSIPELAIIILGLIYLKGNESAQVTSGVTLGEPFVELTFGFSVFGMLTATKLNQRLNQFRNGKTFIFIFISTILVFFAIFIQPMRLVVPVLLVLLYIGFTINSYNMKEKSTDEISYPKLGKRYYLYLVISILLLFVFSNYIIRTISIFSMNFGISVFLISSVIIPIATILPELMNSIIWGMNNRINLALGNLSGEALIFVTIYPALSIASGRFAIFEGSIILTLIIAASSGIAYSLWKFTKFRPMILVVNIIFFLIYLIYLLYY